MNYLHTMIRVSDLDAALDFFCNKLDMVEVRRMDSEQGRFSLIFLAASGDVASIEESQGSMSETATRMSPVLELTHNWDESEYDSGQNFGHLAYSVENIYETCQKLMDKGVVINRPPREGKMAFVKSPDGISLELLQQGEALAIQEPWASMENIGAW